MESAPLTPKKIGHYRLLSKLGEGGMGEVFLAQDDRLNRQVAVKCLKSWHTKKDEQRSEGPEDRLRREARMQAQLNHPNVVHIYDVIEDGEQLALVMEFVDGKSLSRYLKEHSIDIKQKLIWLLQISRGLAAAHDKGLIHRDLKAANILIDHQMNAKITDFGIAKDQMSTEDEETEVGQVLGSYTALSPEQAMGLTVDHRSDLFSLGILAFRLLCGPHPFGGSKNKNVLVQNILHKEPLSAKKLNPQLSNTCINLLERLLAKKPENRPQSAKNVCPILQQCISAQGHLEQEQTEDISETLDVHFSRTQKTGNQFTNLFSSQFFGGGVKRYLFITVSIIAITIGCYFSWQITNKPDSFYVAVLPPSINIDVGLGSQKQTLLKSAVSDAVQQFVIATDNLYLISPSEVRSIDGSHEHIARATAADVLLETALNCQNTYCEITLNRLQKAESNGVESQKIPWTVVSTEQWKTLDLDSMIILNQATVARTSRLFSEFKNDHILPTFVLTEEKYSQFLALYNDAVINNIDYERILQVLTDEQDIYQLYLPYYDLYQYLSFRMFDDTKDVTYLDLLERQLQKADRLIPDQLLIKSGFVRLYLRRNDPDSVTEMLEQFMLLNPNEDQVLELKVKVLEGEGDFYQAIALLEQLIEIRPTKAYWLDLALDQMLIGDTAAANDSLKALFLLNEDDYQALKLQGHLALADADLELAIESYNKAVLINPEGQNYSNLGIAYMLSKSFDEAYPAFQRAVDLAPENAIYNLNVADSLILLGQPEEAEQYYSKVLVLEEGKEDWSSLLNQAQAYAHLQMPSDAIKLVHQSLRLAPDNGETLFTAALVYSLSGESMTSLVSIEQSLNQGVNAVWYLLPWFDGICEEQPEVFNNIIENAGIAQRCSTLTLQ